MHCTVLGFGTVQYRRIVIHPLPKGARGIKQSGCLGMSLFAWKSVRLSLSLFFHFNVSRIKGYTFMPPLFGGHKNKISNFTDTVT